VNLRFLHKMIGIVLVLPLIGWAATGAIFFVKPGYGGAYETLAVKTYPMAGGEVARVQPGWREARLVRTVLGPHLLVRSEAGWRNMDPVSLQPLPIPGEEGLTRLFTDAFTAHPDRYGKIVRLVDRTAVTDTGVEVVLDWDRLTLQQRGRDTARIDALYRIHYLQWTGHKTADKWVGGIGLLLLVALSGLGVRLAVRH
jgi:hypothetical protein